MLRKIRNEKGFTLIELMVVIVIIGILAAVAIPRFIGAQDRAKKGAAESDVNVYRQALGLYEIDKATFVVTGADADLTVLRNALTGYISTLPSALSATESVNFTNYSYTGTATTYTLTGRAKNNATSAFTATPEGFSWD